MIALALLTWNLTTAEFKRTLDPFYKPSFIATRDTAVRNGIDSSEYTTQWNPSKASATDVNDTSFGLVGMDRLVYDSGNGSIDITRWRPRDIGLNVKFQRASQVTVRQFYFPNWRARTDDGVPLRISPSQQNGLMSIEFPSGHYNVTLRLEALQEEFIGGIITISSAASIAVCLVYSIRRRSYRDRRSAEVWI